MLEFQNIHGIVMLNLNVTATCQNVGFFAGIMALPIHHISWSLTR